MDTNGTLEEILHQVNTSLGVISGQVQLLLTRPEGWVQAREALSTVWAEAERAAGLVARVPPRLADMVVDAAPGASPTTGPGAVRTHGRRRPASGGTTVLVADDDVRAADVIGRLLAVEACRVLAVPGDAEAVGLASATHPDVIVLDLVHPGADGLSALRELRRRGEDAVVVVVTGSASVPAAREAMELGAHAYFTKPFDLGLLRTTILDCLAERTRLRVGAECVA